MAGILVTGIVDGRPGPRDLLARLRPWRTGWTWWAVALLPALVMTALPLLLSLVFSDFRPAILDSNDKSGVPLRALGPALLVGSFEEIGWTGFAPTYGRAIPFS